MEVGKDLYAPVKLSLPAALSASNTVTFAIADPTLALVSCDAAMPGLAHSSSSLSAGSISATCYVQGLAASGRTQITASIPGVGSWTAGVALDPSGIAWPQQSATLAIGSTLSSPGTYALDPPTLLPVSAQSFRPGVAASPIVTSSNPAVATVTQGVVTGVAIGTASISITQPAGLTTPSAGRALTVTVPPPVFSINGTNYLAMNTQIAVGFYSLPQQFYSQMTVTSSDPSKLVLSNDANTLGTGTLKLTSATSTVYLQALDDRGTVIVTASVPGLPSASTQVTLAANSVMLQMGNAGGSTSTTTASSAIQLSVYLGLADAVTGNQIYYSQQTSPLPGTGPITVDVQASDPSVGTITGTPVTLNSSGSGNITFQPLAPGHSVISVIQPPGFVATTASSFPIDVSLPYVSGSDIVLGRNTMTPVTLPLANGISSSTSNVNFTVTSSDPSRVLPSQDPNTPGSATTTATLIAGQYKLSPVYVQALDGSGTATVTFQAPGYADTSFHVNLSETVVTATLANSPAQSLSIGLTTVYALAHPSSSFPSPYPNLTVRPGINDIPVTLTSSEPAVVSVPAAPIVIHAGASGATATYQAISPGVAVLSLAVPAPYQTDTRASKVVIAPVQPATPVINVQTGFPSGVVYLGKDLQTPSSVSGNPLFPDKTAITITSSDPSRLLISPDTTTPGQPSIVLVARSGENPSFYLQGLTDDGPVQFSASASGYATATSSVTLAPSAAVFSSFNNNASLIAGAAPTAIAISTAALNPLTLQSAGSQSLRPGANLSVTVSSSDPSVAAPVNSTVSLVVAPGSTSGPSVQVRPGKAGVALLSLTPLHPGTGISPGQELVVIVTSSSQ